MNAGLQQLLAHIAQLERAGRRVPCVNPTVGHYWLAEDAELQEAAVAACRSCPALEACRSYVDAHPEHGGVWAGIYPPAPGRSRERD